MQKPIVFFTLMLFFLCGPSYPSKCTSPDSLNGPAARKGDILVTAGYGTPSIIRLFLKLKIGREDKGVAGYGPIIFKTEYMITNRIGVGLNAGYNYSRVYWMDDGYDPAIKGNRPYEYGVKASELSASLRCNYHFKFFKRIDTYAGIGAGYGLLNFKYYTLAPLNKFDYGIDFPRPYKIEMTCGARYHLARRVGFYTEIGLGNMWFLLNSYFVPESLIQSGISVRL